MIDISKYENIINEKRHVSLNHRPMERINRAAQFAPFAALTGFNETIIETGREVLNKIELTDEEKEMISNKINYLLSIPVEERKVEITYFVPDKKKNGGTYIKSEEVIAKYDEYEEKIILISKRKLNISDILSINSEVLMKAFDL